MGSLSLAASSFREDGDAKDALDDTERARAGTAGSPSSASVAGSTNTIGAGLYRVPPP